MDTYTEIRNKIRAMTGQKTPLLLTGKVVSVGDETCTVSIGDLKLTDVRLRSVINGESSRLLITPAIGSHVTLIDLSGELRETEVIGYSQITAIDIRGTDAEPVKVTINGGRNEGLVKINELTDRLNELVDEINAHTHTGTFEGTIDGAAAAGTVVLNRPLAQVTRFNKIPYEDSNVKH